MRKSYRDPDDPRDPPQDGDTLVLVCQICDRQVHSTIYGDDSFDVEEVDNMAAAHFEEWHPWRTKMIRRLSGGWWPPPGVSE